MGGDCLVGQRLGVSPRRRAKPRRSGPFPEGDVLQRSPGLPVLRLPWGQRAPTRVPRSSAPAHRHQSTSPRPKLKRRRIVAGWTQFVCQWRGTPSRQRKTKTKKNQDTQTFFFDEDPTPANEVARHVFANYANDMAWRMMNGELAAKWRCTINLRSAIPRASERHRKPLKGNAGRWNADRRRSDRCGRSHAWRFRANAWAHQSTYR